MLVEVQRQVDQLDSLFKLASAQSDIQVQARLTEYLCVRVAGFVEQAARQVYYNHARLRAKATVARFVSQRLGRPQNLTADRISDLLKDFDDNWKLDFEKFLTDEHRAALNSVIGNRNNIAHGESVSLGLAQLRKWYAKVVEIVEFLEAQAA